MVQINFALKEVNCKIVFYGPGMSGKTTNLEIVHQKAPEENKGELTSISTDGDRTLFFDFMPLDLGNVAGMRTKFQLYTVPGQVYYNSTRKLVLQGCDGVIFVADSDPEKMAENIESYQNLIDNLAEYGKDIRELPHVIQWNKRDLPNALSVEELDQQMNKFGVPTFEAVAYTGEGVFPTLKTLAGMVLESIDRMDSRSSSSQRRSAPQSATTEGSAPTGTATQRPSAQRPQKQAQPTRQGQRPTAPRKAAARPAAAGGRAQPQRQGRPQPARPQQTRTSAPARRAPAGRAPRTARAAATPSRAKSASPVGLVVTLSVLLVAAAAGVVWFFYGNPLS